MVTSVTTLMSQLVGLKLAYTLRPVMLWFLVVAATAELIIKLVVELVNVNYIFHPSSAFKSFVFVEFGPVKHLCSFNEATVVTTVVALQFVSPIRFVTAPVSVTLGVVGRVWAFQELRKCSYVCCKLNFSGLVSVFVLSDISERLCGKGHSKHQLRGSTDGVRGLGFRVELRYAELAIVISSL